MREVAWERCWGDASSQGWQGIVDWGRRLKPGLSVFAQASPCLVARGTHATKSCAGGLYLSMGCSRVG